MRMRNCKSDTKRNGENTKKTEPGKEQSKRREKGREEMGRKETGKRVGEWKRECADGMEAKEEVD